MELTVNTRYPSYNPGTGDNFSGTKTAVCPFARQVLAILIHSVANEIAMRCELVVQAAGAVVVQSGVPIKPGPARALHFGHKPVDQLLANPGRALRKINEQVTAVANRGKAQRVFVADIVGNADDAVLCIFSNNRIDGRCVIRDARPGMSGKRLRQRALVAEAIVIE